jgi:copper(I)-binding protein
VAKPNRIGNLSFSEHLALELAKCTMFRRWRYHKDVFTRRSLQSLLIILLTASFVLIPTTAESVIQNVSFSRATVTAAPLGGDSAIVIKISNHSKSPIDIVQIDSPVAESSMIGFDSNMCNGSGQMIPLRNVLIPAGSSQKFGYRFQDIMLQRLTKKLEVGDQVVFTINWSNFQRPLTTRIIATVVKPPSGLRFKMRRAGN